MTFWDAAPSPTFVFLFVAIAFTSGCGILGADSSQGACVLPGYGPEGGCGDSYTGAECRSINGNFHEGRSCSELGY